VIRKHNEAAVMTKPQAASQLRLYATLLKVLMKDMRSNGFKDEAGQVYLAATSLEAAAPIVEKGLRKASPAEVA
jgi:hypothetical protein